ncbi:MAG: DUF2723 domain-containing protein [Bacteroidales bacterium]|nr:DUF2723 domain-containing protein [Bacteroidales bacterium]
MRGRVQQSRGQLVNSHFLDILCGWLLAAAGLLLYAFTAEPTVSFWDCGEFIASSYGLEVGHPPGAPFYWLVAHLFCWLSAGNPAHAAYCCNLLSGVATALTAMLLYRSLLLLLTDSGEKGWRQRGAALAAGSVYLVCDTVWFSATESEVYALAMLLASLMVWLLLLWRKKAAEALHASANRLLLLVALLAGLAVCVHFLAILVLPALFVIAGSIPMEGKNTLQPIAEKTPSRVHKHPGVWLFAGGTLLLAVVFKLIVPGWFRLLEFGGIPALAAITVLILSVALIPWRGRRGAATRFTACLLLMFTLGLSPYLIVMLRAQASPPLNEGNPATGEALAQYLRREQYEQAPLLYGRCYNSPVVDIDNGKPVYAKEMNMLFPRMWRNHESDRIGYPDWSIKAGHEVEVQGYKFYKPSQIDNLSFLLGYQVGYMYLRYLMWNFSGRYSDVGGLGTVQQGQLVTGIPPIDRLIVGCGTPPPRSMRSKAYNRYFLLPLLVGITGLAAMRRRNRRAYRAVMTLFLYSGIMVVLYLNMPPYEPRERDYVYILNIYTFCLWIGYGLYALMSPQNSKLSKLVGNPAVCAALCLSLPLLMGWQNLDDHNRHGRQTARDVACNILNSCDSEAILLTYGDNDTFPLWYLQEVEGLRKDVTVVNLSLLATTWYREQMIDQLARDKQLHATLTEHGNADKQLDAILCGNATDSSGYTYPVYLSHYAYRDRKSRYEGRLLLTGTVYRLLPAAQNDSIDVDASLDLLLHHLGWNSPKGTYLDETGRRFVCQYLQCALSVADRLVADGRQADAALLWQRVAQQVELDMVTDLPLRHRVAQSMTAAGCIPQGKGLATKTRRDATEQIQYYNSCTPMVRQFLKYEYDKLTPIFQDHKN